VKQGGKNQKGKRTAPGGKKPGREKRHLDKKAKEIRRSGTGSRKPPTRVSGRALKPEGEKKIVRTKSLHIKKLL